MIRSPFDVAAALAAASFLLLAPPRVAAAAAAAGPGPSVMSEAERAIVAEPAKGLEHGVILLEEIVLNENQGVAEVRYHRRAKVLSDDGRELANVVVDTHHDVPLTSFWARTIFPDGRVVEMPRSDLKREVTARRTGAKSIAYKAALPGVVPGCVIDFGFSLSTKDVLSFRKVLIQHRWPTREFRLDWRPTRGLDWGYTVTRVEALAISVERLPTQLIIQGKDLPPVRLEPLMPPLLEVGAVAQLMYADPKGTDNFWRKTSADLESRLTRFAGAKGAAATILGAIPGTAEGPLPQRLKAVYDALAAKVRNTDRPTGEDAAADRDAAAGADGDEEKGTAASVWAAGKGSSLQHALLLAVLARELGAEARLVLVPDRREGFFIPERPDLQQFDGVLVAVTPVPNGTTTFLEPGSGLPYGEATWWLTGGRGLLCDPAGPRQVTIPSAPAERNGTTTEAKMAFTGDGLRTVTWTTQSTGERGREARQPARAALGDERARELAELCGKGGARTVTRAEIDDLKSPLAACKLSCAASEEAAELLAEPRELRVPIAGPWLKTVPHLDPQRRDHMVVFPYPYSEVLRLAVDAPPGYKPGEPPAPYRVTNAFGEYSMYIRVTATGFEVHRRLKLAPLLVDKDRVAALAEHFARVRREDTVELTFVRDEGAGGEDGAGGAEDARE